ncbi:MAG: threonine/serine exporter family protein [Rikenellaceae bacterium]
MTLIEQLLTDAIFSAIAAMGFAVISNPPLRAVAASAILSAVGHSFRYYLLHIVSLDIATATFLASLLIGVLSFIFAKLMRCPNEIFTFPSLLPMIPGMYAYRMFLSLASFIRSEDSMSNIQLINDIFYNGITAIIVLIALVVGVSIPVMMFRSESFKVTRLRPHLSHIRKK